MSLDFNKKFPTLKYFVILIASVIIFKFLWNDGLTILNQAFKPLILTLIVIYLLDPLADYLNRKTKLSRRGSVIVSYIALIIGLALFGLMIIPSLYNSIKTIIINVSSYDENTIITFLHRLPLLENYIDISSFENIFGDIEELIVNYSSDILNYSTDIIASVGSVLWGIIMFLMALFMAFFALKDSDHIGKKLEDVLKAYMPEKAADNSIRVLGLTDKSIKKYLVSKLYTCFLLGILVLIGILLVNWLTPFSIPYAPLMALLVGLSNLIPYVGFVITIPAVLLALMVGIWEGVILIGIILVTQQIDNLIISPKVIGDHMKMSPFWVIVSLTVGGSLFGFIGMIIAVPIVSVLLNLVENKVDAYKANKMAESGTDLEEAYVDVEDPEDELPIPED